MTALKLEQELTTIEHRPNRATKLFEVDSIFNFTNPLKGKASIEGFAEPGPLTPEINPNYKFPREETVMFCMALKDGDNVYFSGHSGTGKTELVLQVAARLNYNVIQINFDGNLLRSDLIGEIKLEKGETKFRYGLVPYAFQEPGTILLLDEVDAVAPETAFVLQRAVSHDRTLLMLETSELIKLHPQNRIIATANTKGAGDETDLYRAGTNVQNFSFMNRWQTFIEIDYLPESEELDVLKHMFPSLSKEHITGVVRTMSAARTAFKANQISMPLTTRDSINWAKKLTKSSAPLRMAKYTFLNRMSREDALAIAQIIQRNFKLPENDDKSLIKK